MTTMGVLLFSFTIFFADKVSSTTKDVTWNGQYLADCIDCIITTIFSRVIPHDRPVYEIVRRFSVMKKRIKDKYTDPTDHQDDRCAAYHKPKPFTRIKTFHFLPFP